MSLTDEAAAIVQLARRISEDGKAVYGEYGEPSETYFVEHVCRGLSGLDIKEYNFNNPVELKAALEDLWKSKSDAFMWAFITLCTVSAFKSRRCPDDRRSTIGVSAFVYEF